MQKWKFSPREVSKHYCDVSDLPQYLWETHSFFSL